MNPQKAMLDRKPSALRTSALYTGAEGFAALFFAATGLEFFFVSAFWAAARFRWTVFVATFTPRSLHWVPSILPRRS